MAGALEHDVPICNDIGGTNGCEMPLTMRNVLNGGAHADHNVDIQEFMIMPVGAKSFSQALQMGTEVFHHLKSVLKSKNYSTAVGDEGGFAPDLKSNEEAIEILIKAIKKAGYKVGKDVLLALDVAASELYRGKKYSRAAEKKSSRTSNDMVASLEKLINTHHSISIYEHFA